MFLLRAFLYFSKLFYSQYLIELRISRTTWSEIKSESTKQFSYLNTSCATKHKAFCHSLSWLELCGLSFIVLGAFFYRLLIHLCPLEKLFSCLRVQRTIHVYWALFPFSFTLPHCWFIRFVLWIQRNPCMNE